MLDAERAIRDDHFGAAPSRRIPAGEFLSGGELVLRISASADRAPTRRAHRRSTVSVRARISAAP
jgi:hypothetical protein